MSFVIPKGILKSRMEWAILALTVLFLAVTAAFYLWGLRTMARAFEEVVNPPPPETSLPVFKLDEARNIDTHGQIVP